MPKEFYTERDIEDMFRSGIMSLAIHDNMVLTELAYEKARAMGMNLVCNQPENPPCAPLRPYISPPRKKKDVTTPVAAPRAAPPLIQFVQRSAAAAPAGGDLPQRIRDAVLARVGAQVDCGLLDVIIRRVLTSTGVK